MRKEERKRQLKAAKNNQKINKSITLKPTNGAEIFAKSIYKEDSRVFRINDVDIDKIKVSDKKLYNKKHDSYKYYDFYGDDKYIPLNIAHLDAPGYYNIFNDDKKTMNFKLDDDSLGKIF